MKRKINQVGIKLIQFFEGFSPTPYHCANGYKTIGYGHKLRESENFVTLTEREGYEILMKDLEIAEEGVSRYINANITDNQFSALVSFTFNLGAGALQRSTLRQKINYGSALEEVSEEFLKWVFCSGRKVRGLVERREAEAMIYYNG